MKIRIRPLKYYWLNFKALLFRVPVWVRWPLRFILLGLYIALIFRVYSFFLHAFFPLFKEWTEFVLFLMAVMMATAKFKR